MASLTDQMASAGFKPNGGSLSAQMAQAGSTPVAQIVDHRDLLQKASDFITSNNLPGAQLGKALTDDISSLFNAYKALAGGKSLSEADAMLKMKPGEPGFEQVVGDAAQSVALPASLAVGAGGSLLSRLAGSAALGGTVAAGSAAAQGKPAADVAESGVVGAGLGAGGQAVGEGLGALLTKLPTSLVRSALPKLTPGNEATALESTKFGSISSLLDRSQQSVSNLGSQIQTILTHPDYLAATGEGDAAIQKTLGGFPNSEYTPETIVSDVKSLIPEQSKLVSKIEDGTATLQEKNAVRQALDQATRKRFTDNPQLTSTKTIGAKFADALRAEVQSAAPETKPVFAQLSKEIGLRNALTAVQKKLDGKQPTLTDILAAVTGYETGGIKGAVEAFVGERVLKSPAIKLGAAKVLTSAGKALPAVNATGRAIRATTEQQLGPQ
jgi:hypothetical protein